MMMRTFAQFAAVVLPACVLSVDPAPAETFDLEGEITDGAFFVPDPEGGPGIVFDDFPVAYTATFNFQPASSLATFEFTPDTGGPTAPQTIPENLFPGVLQNDAAALIVDYLTSPVQAFMTSFDLTLDKATSQGQWEWRDLCLVCDRSVDPFAQATITSYRVVPEPSTVALLAALFVLTAPQRPTWRPGCCSALLRLRDGPRSNHLHAEPTCPVRVIALRILRYGHYGRFNGGTRFGGFH